jgi:hypothetical protein
MKKSRHRPFKSTALVRLDLNEKHRLIGRAGCRFAQQSAAPCSPPYLQTILAAVIPIGINNAGALAFPDHIRRVYCVLYSLEGLLFGNPWVVIYAWVVDILANLGRRIDRPCVTSSTVKPFAGAAAMYFAIRFANLARVSASSETLY